MQTPNTDAAARNTYEIGGTTVVMTPAAAAAWNAGDLTEDALAGAEVLLLDGARADLWYYIGGAGGWRDCSRHMDGMPANLIRGDAAPVADTRDAAVARVDISICPLSLEAGDSGDIRDGDLVVASIRQWFAARHPEARISVQVGYRQGDEWATIDGNREAGAEAMAEYWEQHADDDSLYEGGGA
jgi:hypothetical protein